MTALSDDDRLCAIWSDGDDGIGYTGEFGDPVEVALCVVGQVAEFPRAGRVGLPTREGFVDGFTFGEDVEIAGEVVDALAVPKVVRADLDLLELVEDVEARDGHTGEAVDAGGHPNDDEVEPSASSWPAGGGAVLVTDLADAFAHFVVELGWEGTVADTGGVGFDDADDFVDPCGTDPGSGARAAGGCVGRRDVGIGTVIDVEERPL